MQERTLSPLGKGFLTGKVDETTTFDASDFRNTVPRFTPENRKANQVVVELVGTIAARKRAIASARCKAIAFGTSSPSTTLR